MDSLSLRHRYYVNLTSRMKTGAEAKATRVITCGGVFDLLKLLDKKFTFFIGEHAEKVEITIQR